MVQRLDQWLRNQEYRGFNSHLRTKFWVWQLGFKVMNHFSKNFVTTVWFEVQILMELAVILKNSSM